MAVIDVRVNDLATGKRRRPEVVLAVKDSAPSARGSTYWRRVLSCPREHLLANELNWTWAERPDALDFGLVWHFVLETLYRGLRLRQAGHPEDEHPDVKAFKVLERFSGEPGWAEGYAVISRMLNAYLERWWTRDQREWQILDVECEIGVSGYDGCGFDYTSRLDLVIIDHHDPKNPVGRQVEHKSSISLSADIVSGYQQDLQILGQVWLGQRTIDWAHYGVPFLGSIINITTKEKEPKNERMLVMPTEEQLDAWESSMRFWEGYRLGLVGEGGYHRNYANCTRKFGRCAFFGFCQSQPDVTASTARLHDTRVRQGEAEMPPSLRMSNAFDDE